MPTSTMTQRPPTPRMVIPANGRDVQQRYNGRGIEVHPYTRDGSCLFLHPDGAACTEDHRQVVLAPVITAAQVIRGEEPDDAEIIEENAP